MIKVLANKILGFTNGELDKKGNAIMHKTKMGFCELPDWAPETAYYKAAMLDGSLVPFQNSATSEEVLKASEKLQALKDEIKALEEKRDLLNTPADATDTELKSKGKAKPEEAKG